ncbi:hypothetical protein EBB07_06865 [Paenibacillaceae bacterium]|nr:hypothetical protein EBB07_06865 [Paenibacillaceae bacterium]
MKWFRRLILLTIAIVILLGLAAWGLISYIAPRQELDLMAEPLDLEQRASDLLSNLKLSATLEEVTPELVLNEADINSLAKWHISRNSQIAPDLMADGAKFELKDSKLVAHVNVTYLEQIRTGIVAEYALRWEDGNLEAIPEQAHIRAINLPVAHLEAMVIPLGELLPEWVEIEDIYFEKEQVRIKLKANVPQLGELLEHMS